jgi:hypothetical protein
VTLGLRESVLGLPFAKTVLEGEETIAAVCPSPPSSPLVLPVTAYTDILPIRITLYLEPDVPDEFGETVRRAPVAPAFGPYRRFFPERPLGILPRLTCI